MSRSFSIKFGWYQDCDLIFISISVNQEHARTRDFYFAVQLFCILNAVAKSLIRFPTKIHKLIVVVASDSIKRGMNKNIIVDDYCGCVLKNFKCFIKWDSHNLVMLVAEKK